MGKILEYIQQSGNGKYQCYKTKKLSLDSNDNDTIAYNYDDKPAAQTNKSIFAETDRSRQRTVSLRDMLNSSVVPPPIFRYFLDGSRHTYKVDDIAIGKKIFPIVAGQIIVGCCKRRDRDTFKKYDLRSKIVISMPDDFDGDDGKENFCRSYCEGNRLSQTIANLKPFERTKVYRYESQYKGGATFYAVWYLRLRNSDFRETSFSDVVKCEMVLLNEDKPIETDIINVNLIREVYSVFLIIICLLQYRNNLSQKNVYLCK
jgi:hypothetical protein